MDSFCNGSVTLRIVQLAHAAGECIRRRRGSDALFPNYFGEDLLQVSMIVLLINGDNDDRRPSPVYHTERPPLCITH